MIVFPFEHHFFISHRRACTRRAKTRRIKTYYSADDKLDERAFDNLKASVVSLVADGAYPEQRALYLSTVHVASLTQLGEGEAPPQVLFPNCRMITRDRAHRARSVDKMFWKSIPDKFQKWLQTLVTGERSLARLIETSEKWQKAFWRKQKSALDDRDERATAFAFAGMLRSFAFADHRFDSRKRPLFRMFRLFWICLDVLEEASSATELFDRDDRRWATEVLQMLSGDSGYNSIVGAAVAADALILAWPFLKVCDKACADFALAAPAAAEALENLKYMLEDGAIWLPAASGTLTHNVLGALKSRPFLMTGRFSDKARPIPMGWPAPTSQVRSEPVAVAKCFYQLFASFFRVHFPYYEDSCPWLVELCVYSGSLFWWRMLRGGM